jgi:hypothetical protein
MNSHHIWLCNICQWQTPLQPGCVRAARNFNIQSHSTCVDGSPCCPERTSPLAEASRPNRRRCRTSECRPAHQAMVPSPAILDMATMVDPNEDTSHHMSRRRAEKCDT